jgi:tetraacyldisaccharide 4'-kinase
VSLRPPEFWDKDGARAPFLEALAWPISLAYARLGEARLRAGKAAAMARPVICVGNATLGGAGKTPVARALAALLRGQGVAAHVLARGYGGALKGPLRIESGRNSAREVGDEILLHARDGPAWIARDRAAGARAAIAAGAEAIILDDGFQNPGLAKTISLLVFDAAAGIGNGKVFPAGPLRERLGAALARADALVLMGEGQAHWLGGFPGPVLRARLAPAGPPPTGPLVAFAGIGRPEKFFATLGEAGGDIAEAVPFADHHVYRAGDLDFLRRLAAGRGAHLITTEKDHVRLAEAERAGIAAFPVTARFADESALARLLARALHPG